MVKNPVYLIKPQYDVYKIIRGACYVSVPKYFRLYRRNCAYQTNHATKIGCRICLRKLICTKRI